MESIYLAPSIQACDFTRLGEEVRQAAAAGAEYIHVDVMDGRLVPNISIGLPIVQALRPLADELGFVLDVHLMIVEPERYLEPFAEAGADILTVHQEVSPHLHRTLQAIKELGLKAGVALNPATPLALVEPVLDAADQVIVMSVNPGFGGQSYIPASTGKISRLRQLIRESGSRALIEVDGGVKLNNAGEIVTAGADILVAGTAIFGGSATITDNIQAFQKTVRAARSLPA